MFRFMMVALIVVTVFTTPIFAADGAVCGPNGCKLVPQSQPSYSVAPQYQVVSPVAYSESLIRSNPANPGCTDCNRGQTKVNYNQRSTKRVTLVQRLYNRR